MLIRTLLDSGDLDIVAFVETWCTAMPSWIADCVQYQVVWLDGMVSAGRGRDKRGICVFVKKGIRISGI